MKNILFSFVLMLAGGLARAQNPAPAAAPYLPDVYVGTGASYNYYGQTGFSAHTEIALRVSGTLNYSYTTIDMTSQLATLRTGGFRVFYQSGNWILGGLVDAGVSYGAGLSVGSFSGSPLLFYDLGARLTKNATHFYVGFGPRVVTMGANVQPIAEITFGKGF